MQSLLPARPFHNHSGCYAKRAGDLMGCCQLGDEVLHNDSGSGNIRNMNELQHFNSSLTSKGQSLGSSRVSPISLRGAVFFLVGMLLGYVFIGF